MGRDRKAWDYRNAVVTGLYAGDKHTMVKYSDFNDHEKMVLCNACSIANFFIYCMVEDANESQRSSQ